MFARVVPAVMATRLYAASTYRHGGHGASIDTLQAVRTFGPYLRTFSTLKPVQPRESSQHARRLPFLLGLVPACLLFTRDEDEIVDGGNRIPLASTSSEQEVTRVKYPPAPDGSKEPVKKKVKKESTGTPTKSGNISNQVNTAYIVPNKYLRDILIQSYDIRFKRTSSQPRVITTFTCVLQVYVVQ